MSSSNREVSGEMTGIRSLSFFSYVIKKEDSFLSARIVLSDITTYSPAGIKTSSL